MHKLAVLLTCGFLLTAATAALAQSRTQREVDSAIKVLKTDKDVKNRTEAINKLGEVALIRTAYVKPAIPALVEAMADGSVEVRRTAATVLGLANLEHKLTAPVLIKALDKQEDRTVRIAAATALNNFGSQATDAIMPLSEIKKELDGMPQDSRDNQLLQAVNRALATIQASFKEQAEQVIAQLRSGADAAARVQAIDDVAKLAKTHPAYADQAYRAIVDAWIKDRDAEVRKAVQDWIRTARPEPKVIVTPLLQILSNPGEDKLNRLAAATMLGGMRGDARDALAALNELKGKEKDADVLNAVGFALRRIQAAVDDKQ